jgi:hypothetical protein
MSSGDSYVTTFTMDVENDGEVSSKLDQLAGKVQNVGTKGEEAAKKTSSFTSTLKSSALGITATASAATSLYFQYDNLEKGQARVHKEELGLSKAREAATAAQNNLNKLVAQGVTGGAEYEAALLNLQQAQSKEEIKLKDLSIAQGDFSQSQLQFALGVVPTAFSAVTSLTGVMDSLKKAKLLNAVASGAEAAAEGGSRLAKIASIPTTFAATAATQGYGMAIKGAMLALGPIGWALMGVTTVMGLFATNAFGVRDAINQAGKAIGDAFPLMRPMLEGLTSLAKMVFPESEKASEDAAKTISAASFSASTEGSAAFDMLASNVDKSADDIVKDAARIENAMQKIGANPKTSKSSEAEAPAGFNWIGFGKDIHNKMNPSTDGGSGMGGGTITLKLELDEGKLIRVIEKANDTGVNVIYNSH